MEKQSDLFLFAPLLDSPLHLTGVFQEWSTYSKRARARGKTRLEMGKKLKADFGHTVRWVVYLGYSPLTFCSLKRSLIQSCSFIAVHFYMVGGAELGPMLCTEKRWSAQVCFFTPSVVTRSSCRDTWWRRRVRSFRLLLLPTSFICVSMEGRCAHEGSTTVCTIFDARVTKYYINI